MNFVLVGGATENCAAAQVVAQSAAWTIDIRFSPTAPGARSGTASVSSTGTPSPLLIALTGDAVGVAAPGISSVKTSLSFGPVAVGAQSTVQELWLTNTGSTNLNVSAITIGAPFALAAGTCDPAPFGLTPGQACLLQLQFSPTSPGVQTGTLTFASNAGELSVALAGEALAAPPANQIVAGSAPSNTGGGGSIHPAVVCVLLLALGVIARRSAPNA